MRLLILTAAVLSLAAGGPVSAQTSAQAAAPTAICADRPGKGTSACTVDPGHWQVEVDAADLTHDRSGGVTTDLGVFASANVKYGVADGLDLELTVTPWQTSRASGSGQTRQASGFGDMVARTKLMLTGPGAAVSAALDPYIKLPTAEPGLGDGAYEAGLVAPVSLSLPGQTSLALTPEIDWLQNAGGHGRHLNLAGVIGLSRALTPTLTGGVELWGALDDDPDGRTRQASFDLSLAWSPASDQTLQLDGGLNFGLNRATPAGQAYVGVSRRF